MIVKAAAQGADRALVERAVGHVAQFVVQLADAALSESRPRAAAEVAHHYDQVLAKARQVKTR